jgi:competence protein ComEA
MMANTWSLFFTNPMLYCVDMRHKHQIQKEEKMLNRKIVIPVLVAVFVGVVSALNVDAGAAEKININTASVEELTQLKGIGPSHAAKIIEFRQKNGPFKIPEDLIKVPGIGQKTFEKNKDLILVEESK